MLLMEDATNEPEAQRCFHVAIEIARSQSARIKALEATTSIARLVVHEGRRDEALDLTTPSGRALAGMLTVFAEFERDILRDRVKAGIAQARKEGRLHGRLLTVAKYVPQVRALAKKASTKGRSPAASHQPDLRAQIFSPIRIKSLRRARVHQARSQGRASSSR
jgi:hypothetical protein